MEFIALLVFAITQVVLIPLVLIGGIVAVIKQVLISKKLGVSSTAVSVIGNRWVMDVFDIRKDASTVKLYHALPNSYPVWLRLLMFPSFLRYKISGKRRGYASIKEQGTEGMENGVITRTIHFDHFIDRSKDKVEQFVVMGAGFDTRCYGELQKNKFKCFELDQAKTQRLKKNCLKKAGIDSSHVVFVEVDFATDRWYEKLEDAGYDPSQKTIFLWEGVTVYLSERDVRKTLKEIKAHSVPGSILVVDFYSNRMASLKGVKATNEQFNFMLDFSAGQKEVLRAFLESEHLALGDYKFMGDRTKKGAFGVVAEVVL